MGVDLRGCLVYFSISKSLYANIVDPDQTAPSDLGLYCLPMPHFMVHYRREWVKVDTGFRILLLVITKELSKTLSHFRAHVVNHLLREKRKSVPKTVNGKTLLKNVTLQILNFILVS